MTNNEYARHVASIDARIIGEPVYAYAKHGKIQLTQNLKTNEPILFVALPDGTVREEETEKVTEKKQSNEF